MNTPTNENQSPSKTKGALIVISGPSGVGKSLIVKHVLAACGGKLSVSATTRPMRRGDVEGRDYLFVNHEKFAEMIANDELLEWADVFDNKYGTPRQPVLDALARGELIVCEIDVQGGIQIKESYPDCLSIFILPPEPEELFRRLRKRAKESGEDEATQQRRYAKAQAEMQQGRESAAYDEFIINDDLARAQAEAADLVSKYVNKTRAQSV